MTHSPPVPALPGPALAGPALQALAAGAGRPAFLPEAVAEGAAGAGRDRIWDLPETLHCSIVGTCLTTADARSLLAKLNLPDARTMSEHRLHGQVVHIAGRKEGGGRLLQKALDRRHEREVRRFSQARTAAEVRALWRESLAAGDIPGAYWAAITHPATDWPLVQDIFGEVHMLSHLVGQSNRADIRRLRSLEADLAERDEALARQERRILDLTAERDALDAQRRARASADGVAAAAPEPREAGAEREAARAVAIRLDRERAHAQALEEKLAVLMQATGRLSGALEAETALTRTLRDELAALEAALAEPGQEGGGGAAPEMRAIPRTILYVGGRPRQVANLRRFASGRGGRLLSHDGGIEDSLALLPGLVGQADLVLMPVDCVSHEAMGTLKRACLDRDRPFRPLRSASLASFVRAVMPGTG